MLVLYTTMLINLKKTEDELWEQIGNLRTDVRKWLKNGVTVEVNPTERDIEESYALYLKMMKKKYLLVESSYILWDSDTRKIIVAKKDNKVVSYIQFQFYSNTDILWKSKICAFETIATDDDYKQFSPNTVLYWEGMLAMKKMGFEYLNFNGVSYEYGGQDFNALAFYKRKWNGLEVEWASKKSLFGYIYWKYFRKYLFVKKCVYFLLPKIFKKKFIQD